jgi:subtilisin family serine protease
MRKNKSNKNNVSLLPYISEELHGLSPNDPQEQGWELTKFNIPNLWSKTDGEGVIVSVIDTGCALNHPDLKDNMLEGKNFIKSNSPPEDDNGHGSHVASTIAACDNGIGMVGIAPKTRIIPVKALDNNGSGSIENIIKGIIWSADRGGVNFITMSLGSSRDTPALKDAIDYANSKGCIVFCAAGNSGEEADIMYPAKYEGTISIGAIDSNLNRTDFTCSGESLDFLAPGHNILGCLPGNRYALMSGTSMSNPFAVGCASLLLSYNLKYNRYTLKNYKDYIEILKKSCFSLQNPKYKGIKKYQGYGIINISSLLK